MPTFLRGVRLSETPQTDHFISDHFDRLLDIVHADQKLYLVFEFLDVDLKRYMENGNGSNNPISLDLVKVRLTMIFSSSAILASFHIFYGEG